MIVVCFNKINSVQ